MDVSGGAMTRAAIAIGWLLALRPAFAQPTSTDSPDPCLATPEDRCRCALDARAHGNEAPHCRFLAAQVVTTLLHRARPAAATAVAAAAAQPRITDTPGGQASAAQSAAIASGQPVANIGGSV